MSFDKNAVRKGIKAAQKASKTVAKAIMHFKDATEKKPVRNAVIAVSAVAAIAAAAAIIAYVRKKNENGGSGKGTKNNIKTGHRLYSDEELFV
jgi:hypothetical protein